MAFFETLQLDKSQRLLRSASLRFCRVACIERDVTFARGEEKGLQMRVAIGDAALSVLLVTSSARAQRPELVLQTGHLTNVLSVAFSPDGRTLASSGTEGFKLWVVATGRELRSLTGQRPVAFSPDGETLASGSGDNYEAQTPLELGLAQTLAWYKEAGWLK